MKKIEFVSYDGKWPALCCGILILMIDDKKCIFENILSSSGSVLFSSDYKDEHFEKARIETGPWKIHEYPEDFTEEDKKNMLKVVNDNVAYGCCGGCI